jgi:hypothetical protein
MSLARPSPSCVFHRFIFLVVVGSLGGCGEPVYKPGKNWIPKSVGGPIETRPLPNSSRLAEDYREWLSSDGVKLRLYEVTVAAPTQQLNFNAKTFRSETPVGRTTTTLVTFVFSNSSNNVYQLEWMAHGRQDPDLVKVTDQPKKFLVRLLQTKDVPMPRLQIVAIEGIESTRQLVASEEHAVP